MLISDFFHTLDQWLCSIDQLPATPDSASVVQFELPSGYVFATEMLFDGRVELFASPGYAHADMIQTIMEDEEEEGEVPERNALLTVLAWHDNEANWQLEMRPADGLMVLTHDSAAPESVSA